MSKHETATGDAPSSDRATGAADAAYQLVFFSGDELKTYDLPPAGDVTIGRAENNAICIDDPSVSRQHAVLHVGSEFVIEDLGAQNGTFLREKAHADGSSETLSLRQLVRRKAEVTIGDNIVVGAVSTILRRAPRVELPRLAEGERQSGIVVRSPALKALYEQAVLAARGNISLLILGETGVGKDVLARAIHAKSKRAEAPFMSINCAALTESLLESELFGSERGAFTGALQARAGLFEAASPGTVFLDEVGELPLATQAKLLRVLEDRAVTRVGATKPRAIDVRFIAATNRDLEAQVSRGAFRQDLFFRLNGIALVIPPLRERREEIESLVGIFLAATDRELERTQALGISGEALGLLLRYDWPGNVRELRNAIERAAVLCTSDTILPEHLPPSLRRATPPAVEGPAPSATARQAPLAETKEAVAERFRAELRAVERARIEDALARCDGNQTRAAELLGISRRTLVSRLAELGVDRPRARKPPGS